MTDSLLMIKIRRQRLSTFAGLLIMATIGLSGATVARSASANSPSTQDQPKRHWYQVGRASWYGGAFQGRATASGESYNMTDLTCAHRSLPIGTLIRVTNLVNHKSVVVRVNDRGPMLASRVVDLSYAAAHFLGFSGITQVRLDVLRQTNLAEVQFPTGTEPVVAR